MLDALLDALFPPRCAACRELLPGRETPAPALPLCAACEDTLEPVTDPCPRCGVDTGGVECPACALGEPPFDSLHSPQRYGAAIADILHRYKYGDHPELAAPLADRIAELALPEVDVVVPVPLHVSRRRSRTYDQALYLAQALARRMGRPVATDLLVRTRATRRQVGRSRDDRAGNVAGAFAAAPGARGLRVLLVDDVVTTTATVAECARVLKDSGATSVHVASVARAT